MKIIAKFQFLIAGRYCLHTQKPLLNAFPPPINLEKRFALCVTEKLCLITLDSVFLMLNAITCRYARRMHDEIDFAVCDEKLRQNHQRVEICCDCSLNLSHGLPTEFFVSRYSNRSWD
jgi:hypothetical protein